MELWPWLLFAIIQIALVVCTKYSHLLPRFIRWNTPRFIRWNTKTRYKASNMFQFGFGSNLINMRGDWIPEGEHIVDCPARRLFLLSNGEVYLNTYDKVYDISDRITYNRGAYSMLRITFDSPVRRVVSCRGHTTIFLMSDQKTLYFMKSYMDIFFWDKFVVQRPHEKMKTLPRPFKIKLSRYSVGETIKDISCGTLIWGALLSNGSLILYGNKIGLNNQFEHLPFSQPTLSLKMGFDHALVLVGSNRNAGGSISGFGLRSYSQRSIVEYKYSPVRIHSHTNICEGAIRSIFCKEDFSSCITTSFQLYTWKTNPFGLTLFTQPTLVTNPYPNVKLIKIATSALATFILGEDETGALNIYYYGFRIDEGQFSFNSIISGLYFTKTLSTFSVDQIVLQTCDQDMRVLILPHTFTFYFFEFDAQEVDERFALLSNYRVVEICV